MVDARERRACNPRTAQMIRCLAAAIVENDRFAKGTGGNDCRQRRQQKRRVRRGKDVDDVRARQLLQQQRSVGAFGDERAEVFDPDRPSQDARRWRVDRREPRIDVRIVVPQTNAGEVLTRKGVVFTPVAFSAVLG